MKRNVSIEEISDGRLYGANDMVKADTGGCEGCSACCHGMGNSIILDPYDIWQLCRYLGQPFERLLEQYLELNVVDGLILPNLRMTGEKETCGFLDHQGRCSIHPARPGVCRLFPLGRVYEGRDFQYFLQVHECSRCKTKVKVKRWVNVPEFSQYEAYIRQWHYFLEDVSVFLEREEQEGLRKQVTLYLLKEFFVKPWEEEAFYLQFERRMEAARQFLGFAG